MAYVFYGRNKTHSLNSLLFSCYLAFLNLKASSHLLINKTKVCTYRVSTPQEMGTDCHIEYIGMPCPGRVVVHMTHVNIPREKQTDHLDYNPKVRSTYCIVNHQLRQTQNSESTTL